MGGLNNSKHCYRHNKRRYQDPHFYHLAFNTLMHTTSFVVIQVFDGTNLNGTPVLIGEALAKNNFSFDIPVRGISMNNGITIANSTGSNGAIVNVSGTTDCFFTVLYKKDLKWQ
jgi:hypothetical protein